MTPDELLRKIAQERADLERDIRWITLSVLRDGSEGYCRGIADQLGFKASVPVVRRVLIQMESEGLLSSRFVSGNEIGKNMARRYYRLTESGFRGSESLPRE